MQRAKDFAEYLYLLLPSALKQTGKKLNSWWALCRALGRRFDDLKTIVLNLREMTMILTCPEELLPIIGQERGMPRLKGEGIDLYRRRLTMKRPIAEQAGTNTGIRAMMQSFGYENVEIEPAYLTDSDKWAEATVWISGGNLVLDDRDVLQEELNNIKPASALLHLAQEQHQYGTMYFGVYLQVAKVLDMREV